MYDCQFRNRWKHNIIDEIKEKQLAVWSSEKYEREETTKEDIQVESHWQKKRGKLKNTGLYGILEDTKETNISENPWEDRDAR